MSVHLSASVDFVNIFIRYRSRHLISEISVMVTEMFSTSGFSCKKKLFLRNENLNKFHKCLFKVGITNLWITPELVRASQSDPKSPRAGKSHARITQNQPEPASANQSQERANENLI